MDLSKKRKPGENEGVEIPKESISLAAVFTFLGVIFILLTGMLVYLRFSSWSPFADFFTKKIPQTIVFSDIYNKSKSQSAGETVEIKIVEEDLAQSIGISNADFPLKKASLSINPGGILISGRTSTGFWGIKVEVLFEPRPIDGKMAFNIKEIKAGGVVAPPKISDSLAPKMSNIFNGAFSGTDNLTVINARLLVHYMILEVRK